MISKQIIKVMRRYNSVFNKYNKNSEEIIEVLITHRKNIVLLREFVYIAITLLYKVFGSIHTISIPNISRQAVFHNSSSAAG